MLKSRQMMLTALSLTGVNIAYLFPIPLLIPQGKALASSVLSNPESRFVEPGVVVPNQPKITCSKLYKLAQQSSPPAVNSPTPQNTGVDNNSSPQKAAPSSNLRLLGTIGGNPVYQDTGTGLIIVFIGLVQYAYDSISDAIAAIGGIFQSSDERNPAQDQRLSPGEIEKLKRGGVDVEGIKRSRRTGSLDLFKDKKGNIYVKPKDGSGLGDDTGYNINDF